MEPRRPLVFISYAREDFYLAEQIYAHLLRAGADPWLDLERLGPADPWRPTLEKAIADADVVAVIASRRSMAPAGADGRASFVQEEIALARTAGKPLAVLAVDGTAFAPGLADAPVHDVRPSVRRAVADLCDGLGEPQQQLKRTVGPPVWPVPFLLVLGLFFAALTAFACAAWRSAALTTPLAELHSVAVLGTAEVPERLEIVVIAGMSAGTGVILLCCALALARRRWQTSFVVPFLVPFAILLGQAVLLPGSVQLLERYPGSTTTSLATEAGALRWALFVSGVVVLLAMVASVGSVAVLASSLVGRGSLPARFRVVRRGRTEAGSWGALLAIVDNVGLPFSLVEDLLEVYGDDLERSPGTAPRTYRIEADPSDRGLADEFGKILDAGELRAAEEGLRADLRLALISNAIAHQLDSIVAADEDVVLVVATSIQIDKESPALRKQLVDFRGSTLSAGASLRLVGAALPHDFRWFPSALAPGAFRLPMALYGSVVGLLAVAFWLALTVVTDVYGLVAGRPVGSVRLVFAVVTVIALVCLVDALVGRRRTSAQLLPIILLTAAADVAYGAATLADGRLFLVIRLASAAIALWMLWPLLTLTREFRTWLPAVPLKADVPGTRRPPLRRGWSVLVSPFPYPVLLLLLLGLIFRPL